MKESKLILRVECYLAWFVINFLICLLPIIITAVIKAKVENIIAGYLGFIFTRLVGSFFIFYSKRKEEIFDQLIFAITFLCTLVSLACLPLYTTVAYVTNFFNDNPLKIILYSLLLTIFLCILLNRKGIESKVLEKQSLILMSSNPKETAEELQNIKIELEKS